MKFGIFYEHQLLRPWGERSEYDLLQNSLAQIELADRLGYDYAYTLYAHQNEDIVRLTPEELKAKMAAKERARDAATGSPAADQQEHPAHVPRAGQ